MPKVSSLQKIISSNIKDFTSINDLRDVEYRGSALNQKQKIAVKNYDKFRITELNKQISETDFHKKYLFLQVLANLSPYEEFLKEDYFL